LHANCFLLRIELVEEAPLSLEPEGRMDMALQEARQGHGRAFEEIVREHQAMVFSIGFHFLADRGLAEDLSQDVFLQLYQHLAAIESAKHLVHWLRRVAVHRCIDHSRRKYFHRESPLDETHEIAVGSAPADSFLSERLRQSVAQLREKQRMVIVLHYQEELELREIAEVLDMPLNTVKSTLHRALENLRERLTRKVKEARYAFL
jgi:RNA polymerase sigma-70 factor, ECF subfamily